MDDLHRLRETLAGKWTLHLLVELADGSRRFSELAERLDVPEKTLSRRLKELRARGALERSVTPTSPPTTRYELTDGGRELVGAIETMRAATDAVPCEPCESCDGDVLTVDAEATTAALEWCQSSTGSKRNPSQS